MRLQVDRNDFRPSSSSRVWRALPVQGADADQSLELRSFRRQALVFLFCFLTALWGGLAYYLVREYQESVRYAEIDTRNLSLAFENQVDSSLRRIDLALRLSRELWVSQPQSIDVVTQQLFQRQHVDGLLSQHMVVDADGRLQYSTLGGRNESVTLSGREFFAAHKRASQSVGATGKGQVAADELRDSLFIDVPMQGRYSGQRVVFVSRAIFDAEDLFDGVVAVVVDPRYFSRSLESLKLGAHGIAVLLHQSGQVIAHAGGVAQDEDRNSFLENWAKQVVQRDGSRAEVPQQIPIDGEKWIVSYRRHSDFPIMVAFGRAESDLLNEIFKHCVDCIVFVALISLVFTGMTYLLIRVRTRLAREQRIAAGSASHRLRRFNHSPSLQAVTPTVGRARSSH